jgi:hypothetical protein
VTLAVHVTCKSLKRNVYIIFVRNLKERDYLEDLGIMDDTEMEFEKTKLKGVDQIHHAQERGRWQAFVNMVMKLMVP